MPSLRKRTLTAVLIAGAMLGLGAAAVLVDGAGADATGDRHGFPPNVDRVDLSGYVIEASYSLGRNTGSTFEQTYGAASVQGVPVAGPFVGTTFPPQDYVALAIAPRTVYIVWQDPETHAIVDAFVMNFKTGVVFDYAPGSDEPESSGRVRILRQGTHPLP